MNLTLILVVLKCFINNDAAVMKSMIKLPVICSRLGVSHPNTGCVELFSPNSDATVMKSLNELQCICSKFQRVSAGVIGRVFLLHLFLERASI